MTRWAQILTSVMANPGIVLVFPEAHALQVSKKKKCEKHHSSRKVSSTQYWNLRRFGSFKRSALEAEAVRLA